MLRRRKCVVDLGNVEHGDRILELSCLLLQRLRSCSKLFDQRGVLLSGLIHVGDDGIDLFDALALLYRLVTDRTNQRRYGVNGMLYL